MSRVQYPLEEGVVFRFVCLGCESKHVTTIPKHNAPFVWRCVDESCGWVLTVQSDPAGVSAGFTAPLRRKPVLTLVEGGK